MVLLKFKTVFLLSIMLITAYGVSAQTSDDIVEAFSDSYALEKEGEYKKAAETLKKVYNDDSYEMNLRLGWLYYNAGLFDQSGAHYQKAANIHPYATEPKLGLVYPKAAQGKWAEVENIYKKILENDPLNSVANYRVGLLYYGQKKYEKAMKHFQKVINLYPFDYDTLLMCGWTAYFMGKKREAKVYFNKCLMYDPDSESAKQGLEMLE